MIEILDNVFQLVVTTGCTVWTGVFAFRHKNQHYSILACFYGTFALGLLYWLIYLMMNNYTPKIFYVSDLSWVSSFLFLLMLNLSLAKQEEKGFCPPLAIAVVVVLVLLTLILMSHGDLFITLIWCSFLIASAYLSTRGLVYARRQSGQGRQMQYLYFAILFVIFAEFMLWLVSCYFKSDTLENPYFWCDFLLTGGLLMLLPAMKKAVAA